MNSALLVIDMQNGFLGVRRLILAGTTTPNCIRTTCYDALSLDYEVTVLSDCTSSVSEEIQRANLLDMAWVGARIVSSEEPGLF